MGCPHAPPARGQKTAICWEESVDIASTQSAPVCRAACATFKHSVVESASGFLELPLFLPPVLRLRSHDRRRHSRCRQLQYRWAVNNETIFSTDHRGIKCFRELAPSPGGREKRRLLPEHRGVCECRIHRRRHLPVPITANLGSLIETYPLRSIADGRPWHRLHSRTCGLRQMHVLGMLNRQCHLSQAQGQAADSWFGSEIWKARSISTGPSAKSFISQPSAVDLSVRLPLILIRFGEQTVELIDR